MSALAQTQTAGIAAQVRFSNRPFRVKRFQTIHHYSVDVAHGLVLSGFSYPQAAGRFPHLLALFCRANRAERCPVSGGDLNRSTQHLLILLDKEVADGDVTDIVHGEAEG